MAGPYTPASAGLRMRAGSSELRRPIASALPLDHEHVNTIDQSHQRCAAFGLTRIERLDYSPLGRSDLGVIRERNQRLYAHAAPVMEMLYEQIVNSESMVLLCDATGTIIHSIGDSDFMSRASKVALQPGVNWSEQSKGTNAVGTALIEESPTLVHADEHYMHANHFLTCSAAPILDPRGNILGVLDVSGDQRSYHQHTMGLVKMSARMIENHWLTDDYRNVMRLHFHSRVEFIGTLMEGILAVSQDGKLVGANRGALEQLGLSGAALRMHTISSLFGTTVAALVDRFRSPLATPQPVELSSGRQFHVYARFNWPVWHGMGMGGDAAVAAPAAAEGGPSATETAPASPSASGSAPSGSAGEGLGGASRGGEGGNGGGLASLSLGDTQFASLIDKIRRVLNRDIPILILGETGTGKELLARAIHQDSERARQPFVAVNCASIPETLIEAELFGYEEGAFTGARRKGAVGKIVQANGGTLFLDEIGDMPISLQAHLLRVLQERQVTPLGSAKSVSVDVMLVCATHRNLREMIEQKSFREDLYYRLNGLAVRLPALRERSDLMALVERILDRESPERRLRLSPEVVRLFQGYHWPGNVRQLFNVLRTACVMAAGEATITRDHLSDDFIEDARRIAQQRSAAAAAAPVVAAPPMRAPLFAPAEAPSEPMRMPMPAAQPAEPMAALPPLTMPQPAMAAPAEELALSLEDIELRTIQQAVDAAGGNISVAAKRLGISRNTIYRKLRWRNEPRG
ncbi:sigma-54-dependent Fis family transcriptional regulator [Sphaerotilus uruguayifluvii]|uniref:Transcriptional regulator of acetoin/glycerol metabolism n=1 Tax=Sphaerotilus uruguayifluvii TaxID=2735897 RepID=A0ABX2G4H7_9BURK|nr:sigma-54-dependent Fis family transcriptional regulator [Leptothrix sp. C29]NRT57221.1 transcriptional regulator of acetoin/glycerol metabolism [Leptothrix sp. C29]